MTGWLFTVEGVKGNGGRGVGGRVKGKAEMDDGRRK